MYLLVVMVVYIFLAKRFVNWRRWREYYPTIQFYIICNLLYNFLFYQHTLWKYRAVTVDWLNHTLIEISFTFFIVPVVLMIYLEYYPKGKVRGVLYLLVWVAYFSVIEYLFEAKGLFIYENGRNGWWSVLFNIITFIIIKIHFKNALAAILISIPIIAVLLMFFHPALHDLK
ncbi:hypothetical protein EJA10_05380 [Mesobacillus subterraneus]|uniref:Uncharacterized protein n=2 Tax=Mesobacillus subterraneus TaxID=285983 RepID=A0A427TVU5_9BACI|nr:hypothetical protein EJA10_05380 [Mesobacillus subterraneus]